MSDDIVQAEPETQAQATPDPVPSAEQDPERLLASFFKREIDGETGAQSQQQAEASEPQSNEPAEQTTEDPEPVRYDPPQGLTPEQTARFAELAPELQKYIVDQQAQLTQRVGRERDGIMQQAQQVQGLQTELQQLRAQQMAELQKWSAAGQNLKLPSAELRDNDPIEYARQLGLYMEAKEYTETARQEAARLQAAQQAEQSQQYQAWVAEEQQKLAAQLPELFKPGTGEKKRIELQQFALSQGLTQAQLSRASAQEIGILYRAMQWDSAQKGAAKAAQKAAAPPPKAARPGNIQANVAQKSQRVDEIKSRLAKSGRTEDLAALFKETDF